MKRLIFFVGVYDKLDIFTYELIKEFEELEYETMLFDVRKMEEGLQKLAQFIIKPVKAMITFNNLGFNMELQKGKNIWEELNIPCINILMDHPFCYRNAMQTAPYNAIVLCIDRNHMKYMQRFHPNISTVGYLPHGGKDLQIVRKPIAERKIDVMYAGNLSSTFAENVIPDLSKYTKFNPIELCKETYQELITHPWKTTEDVLEEMLTSRGIYLEEEELSEVISDLHFVDLYAVGYYREKAVKVLAEQGVNITLYGDGWSKCDWIHLPNVYYGGLISADEVVEHMQDTKIVLSTMTWFKDGTHDRVFNGMLAGAVAVSDTSGYMEEEFNGHKNANGDDDREMLLFKLEEIEKMPLEVMELLEKPDLAQKIADRGYEKAKKYHTWKARAKELETDLLSQME